MTEELATLIEGLGLGLTRGTNLFIGFVPPMPARCCVLMDSPADPSIYVHGVEGPAIDAGQVAVWMRDAEGEYDAAMVSIDTIYTATSKVANEDVGGHSWVMARPNQRPFLLQRDEARRPLLAFNLSVWRRP